MTILGELQLKHGRLGEEQTGEMHWRRCERVVPGRVTEEGGAGGSWLACRVWKMMTF